MSRARGFTLVEVVVALTILSLVVLATLTALRTLALTQEKLEVRADHSAELRAVSGFLRKTLAEAIPVPMYMFGRSEGAYFYGGAQELIWAAPMPIPGHSGGLFAMRLARNDRKELSLQIREGIDFIVWTDETSYLLAENVEAFTLSYRKSRLSEWQSEWNRQAEKAPPGYVKIALKVDGRYWPDIIVPIRSW